MLLSRTLIVLALAASVTALAKPAARAPNFIVILADDLGYGDLGCYGSTRQRTPHLDALAAGGVRFTDFHANSSVCTPTRAALLTGRYQQRARMEALLGLDPAVGLSPKVRTLPDYLRAAGYATGAFGKWHLGLRAPFTPLSQGFDEFVGLLSGDGDHHSRVDRSGGADWWSGDNPLVEEGYTTDLITRHALGFIERHRSRPFFLYIAHLAVHFPWQGPRDRADRVVGGDYDGDPKFGSSADKHRSFHDMVTALDNSVGRITGRLRELGLEGNTVVVFTSDNGGYNVDRGGYVAVSSNGPWRGQKGDLFEGGHRVAGMISWPGRIAAGRVSHATAMTMDILPTFLELVGVPQPEREQASDGVSLAQHLLRETALAERTVFWRRSQAKAARCGEWKALVLKGEPPRLFNLEQDPAEQEDRSNREPARLARLMQALAAWEIDVDSSARDLALSGR